MIFVETDLHRSAMNVDKPISILSISEKIEIDIFDISILGKNRYAHIGFYRLSEKTDKYRFFRYRYDIETQL